MPNSVCAYFYFFKMKTKKTLLEYLDLINNALKKKHSIVIFAECEIIYSGRAEAKLDLGERILIIKPDKCLLVHQPTGNNPVIYMKPGSEFNILDMEDHLLLKSVNMFLHETVEIKMTRIINIINSTLFDSMKVELFGTEKDMSDYIYKNPKLISKDFKPVSREEQTKYGFIDVFGYDKSSSLVVVECKRTKAGPSAPQQLRRYIERLAKSKGIPINTIKGVLAAPDITKNAKHMLKELSYKFKRIEPPAYMKRKKELQHRLGNFI